MHHLLTVTKMAAIMCFLVSRELATSFFPFPSQFSLQLDQWAMIMIPSPSWCHLIGTIARQIFYSAQRVVVEKEKWWGRDRISLMKEGNSPFIFLAILFSSFLSYTVELLFMTFPFSWVCLKAMICNRTLEKYDQKLHALHLMEQQQIIQT